MTSVIVPTEKLQICFAKVVFFVPANSYWVLCKEQIKIPEWTLTQWGFLKVGVLENASYAYGRSRGSSQSLEQLSSNHSMPDFGFGCSKAFPTLPCSQHLLHLIFRASCQGAAFAACHTKRLCILLPSTRLCKDWVQQMVAERQTGEACHHYMESKNPGMPDQAKQFGNPWSKKDEIRRQFEKGLPASRGKYTQEYMLYLIPAHYATYRLWAVAKSWSECYSKVGSIKGSFELSSILQKRKIEQKMRITAYKITFIIQTRLYSLPVLKWQRSNSPTVRDKTLPLFDSQFIYILIPKARIQFWSFKIY